MTLSPAQIDSLPDGAGYQVKEGNATGTVKKTDKGIEFTANCDSLNVLVEQLYQVASYYRSENSSLKASLKQKEISGPTLWEQIRLKLFPVSAALNLILLVIIFNKYNLWKKTRKLLARLVTK